MMRLEYPVEVTEDAEGFFLVRFPDLKGTATDGRTREEALTEAVDCLHAALAHRIKNQFPIPTPSPAHGRPVVSPSAAMVGKIALYQDRCKTQSKDTHE